MFEKKIVRKAIPKDLRSIFLIEQVVFSKEHWTIEMIADELEDIPEKITWVIEQSQNILGYCMVRLFNNEVNIINMAITPSFQGKGLGRLLLGHILNQIPSKSSVFLEVKQGNLSAINLYLSFGFKEIDVRNDYYRDGSDALVMHLKH